MCAYYGRRLMSIEEIKEESILGGISDSKAMDNKNLVRVFFGRAVMC